MKTAAARDAALSDEESAEHEARTVRAMAGTQAFYDENAQNYSSSTRDLDMAPQLSRFATGLAPGAKILDLGCGGGRDLAAFRAAGFDATGLDISPRLAAIAEEHSGCRVFVGDMRDPPFAMGSFDGVWAAASVLHLRRRDVEPALRRIRGLLTPNGRFFASVKAGAGEKQASDDRLFTFFRLAEWKALLARSGFGVIEAELDREDPSWIQSFARAT